MRGKKKPWNHLVRKKKKSFSPENGVDPLVRASIMNSGFKRGSESTLYELLF